MRHTKALFSTVHSALPLRRLTRLITLSRLTWPTWQSNLATPINTKSFTLINIELHYFPLLLDVTLSYFRAHSSPDSPSPPAPPPKTMPTGLTSTFKIASLIKKKVLKLNNRTRTAITEQFLRPRLLRGSWSKITRWRFYQASLVHFLKRLY